MSVWKKQLEKAVIFCHIGSFYTSMGKTQQGPWNEKQSTGTGTSQRNTKENKHLKRHKEMDPKHEKTQAIGPIKNVNRQWPELQRVSGDALMYSW